MKTCYLAGPMRGYPKFNFGSFKSASEDLRTKGWNVISPADIDSSLGFDPEIHDESFFDDFNLLIRRDIEAVLTTDCTIVLPGWHKSTGAMAEVSVARWAKKSVLIYPSLVNVEDEDILDEAMRLTKHDRQAQYGPPDQDFTRTAAMWSALKGVPFSAQDVATFMICLKMSREQHQRKRDNWVDIAGYARCGSLCNKD